MGTRPIELDDEVATTLERLHRATGLSVSEVVKHGLAIFEAQSLTGASPQPYDVYQRLDLGSGNYAAAPARKAKARVTEAIRDKHGR